MNKYAIISDSIYKDGEWKNFYIIEENLTREQILALKNAIPTYTKELETKHPYNIELQVEGFENTIRGDYFEEYLFGKIIPMSTLENFE